MLPQKRLDVKLVQVLLVAGGRGKRGQLGVDRLGIVYQLWTSVSTGDLVVEFSDHGSCDVVNVGRGTQVKRQVRAWTRVIKARCVRETVMSAIHFLIIWS